MELTVIIVGFAGAALALYGTKDLLASDVEYLSRLPLRSVQKAHEHNSVQQKVPTTTDEIADVVANATNFAASAITERWRAIDLARAQEEGVIHLNLHYGVSQGECRLHITYEMRRIIKQTVVMDDAPGDPAVEKFPKEPAALSSTYVM